MENSIVQPVFDEQAWRSSFDSRDAVARPAFPGRAPRPRTGLDHAAVPPGFNERAWKSRLAQIKAQLPSCGAVYELFARRFTDAVDAAIGAMNDADAERARAVALLDPDYFGDSDAEGGDAGTCPHGLDAWTCPAGCGG